MKYVALMLLLMPAVSFAKNKIPSMPKEELPPSLGAVVQSKEWNIYREKGYEEFIGDVKYSAGGYTATADKVIHYFKNNAIESRGNIYLKKTWHNGNITEARGERAVYDGADLIEFFPNGDKSFIEVKHIVPNDVWVTTAKKVVISAKGGYIKLEGNVIIKDKESELRAPSVIYYNGAAKAEIKERFAVITKYKDKTIAASADKATADDKTGKTQMKGKVSGWIETPPIKKQ